MLLAAGCMHIDVREGPAPGVMVRDGRAPQATVRMNTVNIIDDSLQNWQARPGAKHSKIAVESTNARRSETGTVEIWAVLRNRTDYPLQIEGRVQFFDRDQAPVEGPTAWQRVYLPPNSVATYKELSTKVMEIGYYYVEIREGR
jgi:hypothetical protein